MKYLFILFLLGCNVSAQKTDRDVEFEQLMKRVNETNIKSVEVQTMASKKEKLLVTNAVAKISSLKAEIKDLKNNLRDTIYIHDTIQVKEKKNFWGKVKTDTIK